MKNLPFVIWMICWPPASELFYYLHYKGGHSELGDDRAAHLVLGVIHVMLWPFVAWLLYERKK